MSILRPWSTVDREISTKWCWGFTITNKSLVAVVSESPLVVNHTLDFLNAAAI